VVVGNIEHPSGTDEASRGEMVKPILIYRSRRHLGLALMAAIMGPLMVIASIYATDVSAGWRLAWFPLGVGFTLYAWIILREVSGKKPIVTLDEHGLHYKETSISFDFQWSEISAVSRQEINEIDSVLLHLTPSNYEKFCSRLPNWAQGLFRVHGRWPWVSKLASGVSVLFLPQSPQAKDFIGPTLDIASGLVEGTTPRYAVALPVINLQVSAAELEAMVLDYIDAR
jgi:hypothetical protein